MSDQRLTDLEIKISHQEITLEALQQTTYQQQKTIVKMETKIQMLCKRFADIADGLEIAPANEKPPHY